MVAVFFVEGLGKMWFSSLTAEKDDVRKLHMLPHSNEWCWAAPPGVMVCP